MVDIKYINRKIKQQEMDKRIEKYKEDLKKKKQQSSSTNTHDSK
ncbi:hypothetical protein [uncultured Mediterranean phage uvMED]|jgi:hypothetical protein|nr:hypothetical protein [uncultured Mediterranean phage uvMED]BAR17591.1 hypothetical protein [uncultured Mediterranean phage uvMED]